MISKLRYYNNPNGNEGKISIIFPIQRKISEKCLNIGDFLKKLLESSENTSKLRLRQNRKKTPKLRLQTPTPMPWSKLQQIIFARKNYEFKTI